MGLRGRAAPGVPALRGVGDAPGARLDDQVDDAGEGQRFGLVVDELLGHQQVVIKSIEESYGTVPGIAAATILGNGRVAFILDVEKLSDMAVNSPLGAAITMKAASPALN